MAVVYILFSKSIDRFYVGSCKDLQIRLEEHRSKKYKNSFTAKAYDWTVFLQINNLEYRQARSIEAHIKRMRSKVYINNLLRYPEIIEKLIQKYR